MNQSNAQQLTRVQQQALDFIETFIKRNGYSPSIRELASAMKYESSSTAHNLLERLERKGYISKEASGPRTIRLIKEDSVLSSQELGTKSAQFARMEAALRNILDISTDDFAKHQARYGLGIDK